MKEIKNILLIILAIIIIACVIWFSFIIAIPVLVILGIILILKETGLYEKIKKEIKSYTSKVKEAEVLKKVTVEIQYKQDNKNKTITLSTIKTKGD